jgi:PAS domain S-box-containing protein
MERADDPLADNTGAPTPSPELQLIYDTAPIGLAFLSRDCRYLQINQRLTEICGISVADHIGRSVRETVPAVAEQVELIVQTILRTGEPIIGVEVKGQRPDGSNAERFWITYWHPLRDKEGSIAGINVAAEEITERRRTQAALAASEARFREIAEALRDLNETLEQRVEAQARERDRIWNVSQDLLAVTDTSGKIISVNPAWTATLGWSPNDLLGTTWERLLHPDDRKRSLLELENLIEGRKTPHFENRLRHKSGTYCWLSWEAALDQDLIYAVARDITDLKRAEEQLRAARRELAQVSHQNTMGAMTASIAHEILQPLSAIATNANAGLRWLARPEPNIDEVRAALEQIVTNGRRATEVIASIRSMFRKDGREKIPVNVNALIREVVTLLNGEFEGHQVVLQTEMSEGLPEILAERVQLQQVLLNLIMNAVDAMSSVADRERRLTIKSGLRGGRDVMIAVEDSGTGIDPDHMDRIFEAFFTTKPHGMGMGLSICRSIVESHGGSLWAAPRSPHGTVFYVQLSDSGHG